MDEKNLNICAALVAAQGEFEAAKKDSFNPHFKSNYADLASLINAVRPTLAKHGLAFVQPITYGDQGLPVVSTTIIHKSGESMPLGAMRVPVNPNDAMNAQRVGAAITYARRFHLASALGISQEDDDGNSISLNDNDTRSSAPNQRPLPQNNQRPIMNVNQTPATEKQKAFVNALCKELNLPLHTPKTSQDAMKVISDLSAMKAKRNSKPAKLENADPVYDQQEATNYTTEDIPF